MNFDTILDRLSHVRRRPGGFMARCPAHDDRVQSLSVALGDNDTPLFYCHAGCSFHEVIAALSEGGMVSGESPERQAPSRVGLGRVETLPSSENAEKNPVYSFNGYTEIYDYEDENGLLLFRVLRKEFYEDGKKYKRFFQCHPDPESPTGFYWGLNGVRRVPYRLPRVRKAVEAAQTVYIVEGEKDVHAIERAGGVATCNPMGASKGKSKWRSEWNGYFQDGHVVVVADKDEAGMAHALDVRMKLRSVVRGVTVVTAFQGKDAFDHIEAGYGLYDFVL